MLEIKNCSKEYKKGAKALEGLNLKVNKGDIYGFIGHNGAGKTTTLKAVAGIIDYEGEIIICGMNLKEKPLECKKNMAFIMDTPNLYEYLSGIAYLNFIADVCNISKEEREKEITFYAKKFEIYNHLGDLISSYSHGMKQKLALISALMRNPKILLLDEPFVGLDPNASFILKEIMHEFTAKGGAILFSTHVLEVAQKLCNKVAIIKQGKLIISGDINDVMANKSLEDAFLQVYKNE